MDNSYIIRMFCVPLLFMVLGLHGQDEMTEEPNASVFLEAYTDAFQEKFFEALKQKGIENYDRAIPLLLECRQMDSTNAVVNHELAKTYFGDKNYREAEAYGISAVVAEPDNFWYLDTLVKILQKQGKPMETVQNDIPYTNIRLLQNLAQIYYEQQNYENAIIILKGMKKTDFVNEIIAKIRDARERVDDENQETPVGADEDKPEENSFVQFNTRLAALIEEEDYVLLEQVSQEALEYFPAQPFFYYAHGLALNKALKYREALEMLETAAGYWLEDSVLLDKIYAELVTAHSALGNVNKANEYRSKIKSGS